MIKILFAVLLIHITFNSRAQVDSTSSTQPDSATNNSVSESDTTTDKQSAFAKLLKKSGGLSPTADIRSVDGLFLGLSYKHKKPGGSFQKIAALKSIKTQAYMLQFDAEWVSVFKNTDIVINSLADVQGNIVNYFGRGNDTEFDRSGDFRTFYRVNFSLYQATPTVRFRLPNKVTLSVGPSFQYSKFHPEANVGRFIYTPNLFADDNYQKDKAHAGFVFNIGWDKRDDIFLPTKGFNFSVGMLGYEGLNNSSNSFVQAFPQFSFYKSLGAKSKIVLANRTGAGFTSGTPAFYQNAFLGSPDNLIGFRRFRFAGDNLAYNNFEVRIQLFQNKFPNKIGLIGVYDAGRVWVKNDNSNTIHHGYGGGIYLLPVKRLLVRAVAGFSNEGLQPAVALRQRF